MKLFILDAHGIWWVLQCEYFALYFSQHDIIAGMLLTIKFSGGMGVSYQGSVDLSTLPSGLYETVRTELSEKNLSKACREKKNQFTTDSVTYELQYEDSDQTFTIHEYQVSEELLELIDSLRPYLNLEPK